MAFILCFYFSLSFTFRLWRHMLRHFHKEAMAVSEQFFSNDTYEIKCAGWFTFQMTRNFLPSLANAVTEGFFLDFHCRCFVGW